MANIFSCNSPKGKPVRLQNSTKSELLISYTEAVQTNKGTNRENIEYKVPYLIYYSIDSSEALMKYSVRLEVAKLQKTCRSNPNVRFVAFLNSLYVESNSFIVCKNKEVAVVNLKEFPELNVALKEKRKFISLGDHTGEKIGPLKYLVKYFKETNKAFKNYPLAHPDFVYDLINLVTTNKNFFPSETYAPFLNLKSHGSEDYVLSGMHECQKKAKDQSADFILNKILPKEEIKFLQNQKTIEQVELNVDRYQKILTKLEIGEKPGIGDFGTDTKLGSERLSILGKGLGVKEGLGSEFAFGTSQIHLGWVLDDLFPENSDRSLAFLMLEACDTRRNPHFFHPYLNNVFRYYTAQKSLWYRNLNWWEILEISDGKTINVLKSLEEVTKKIPNIEVIEN